MAVLNSLKRDFGLSLSWPSEGCDSYYEYCPQTILTKRLKTQLLAKHMVRSSGISPRTAAQLRKQTARMRNPAYFSETTPARSFLAAFSHPEAIFSVKMNFQEPCCTRSCRLCEVRNILVSGAATDPTASARRFAPLAKRRRSCRCCW